MGFTDMVANTLGVVEKAVLYIGDTTDVKLKEVDASKPSSGSGGLGGGFDIGGMPDIPSIPNFDPSVLAGSLMDAAQMESDNQFEAVGSAKKYKFEVQFNPAEITISGYGGEKLPTQNFGSDVSKDPKKDGEGGKKGENKPPRPSSSMAAADTRITMSFKVCFDKVDPQDAFYADKFSLNATSIGVGAAKAVGKAMGKKSNSVRPEVEALHAIARNPKKKLAMFVWGNMKYDGVINGVDSEYVMFNVNGEPIRAYVTIRMVLFGKNDLGKNVETWKREYNKSIYSLSKKSGKLGLNVGLGG